MFMVLHRADPIYSKSIGDLIFSALVGFGPGSKTSKFEDQSMFDSVEIEAIKSVPFTSNIGKGASLSLPPCLR